MPSWIVPSDSHVVSDTGHTTDHNHMADDLTLVSNVVPVVSGGLTGAVQATRYAGATTSGAPVSGTFATGDFIIDQSGKVWVCTAAGSPGTWANAGSSSGVSTFNSRSGTVVPGNADYLAVASGGLTGAVAATRFAGGTTSGHPSTGTFAVGDFTVDQTGLMWVCTGAGTPGTWVALVSTTGTQSIAGAKTFTTSLATSHNTLDDGSGNASLAGSLKFTKIATKTSSYALTTSDFAILANDASAAITITLPDATTCTGQMFFVKCMSGNNGVQMATTSAQTIDGQSASIWVTFAIGAAFFVISDGANWQTLAIDGVAFNFKVLSSLASEGIINARAGTDTSQAASPSTPSLVSGTAAQLSTSTDVILYCNIKVTSTFSLAIGPTSTPANTVVTSASFVAPALVGGIRVPQGWFVKSTFTAADVTWLAIPC